MKTITKDITTIDRGIIAHSVNCQRAMGSGVALGLMTKWPEVRSEYMTLPGGPNQLGTTQAVFVEQDIIVYNCFAQEFFGYDGKKYASLDALETCLRQVFEACQIHDLPLYLPKICSDRAGLNWETEVSPLIEELNRVYEDVTVTICVI